MAIQNDIVKNENKIKTVRWLFYLSVFQLLACLSVPILMFPAQILLALELFIALTVGLLFGLYLLGVSLYGVCIDKSRRLLYVGIIIFISAWTIWTIITWRYIEHMRYLT